MSTNKYCIINLRTGVLAGDSFAELNQGFEEAYQAKKKKIVFHFHGGLVSREEAMAHIESQLSAVYTAEDIFPIFIVWETSPKEIALNNFNSAKDYIDDLFRQLTKHRFFVRAKEKMNQYLSSKKEKSTGARGGAGLDLVSIDKICEELDRADQIPFYFYDDQVSEMTDFTEAEINEMMGDLFQDEEFQEASKEIREDLKKRSVEELKELDQSELLLQKDLTIELKSELESKEGARGGVVGDLSWRVVRAILRANKRYKDGTGHGFFPTIVEELIRGFYGIGNVPKLLWLLIKKETANAFGDEVEKHGGSALLHLIKSYREKGYNPDLILSGHSAGSIFICELIEQAYAMNLPGEIVFDLIFMAPACSFNRFEKLLQNHSERIRHLRIFNLNDERERTDKTLPGATVYPLSILYFVCALLEDEVDLPLLGMERFYPQGQRPQTTAYPLFFETLEKHTDPLIWAPSETNNGKASAATSHGDLDDDPITLSSIEYILSKGF